MTTFGWVELAGCAILTAFGVGRLAFRVGYELGRIDRPPKKKHEKIGRRDAKAAFSAGWLRGWAHAILSTIDKSHDRGNRLRAILAGPSRN